jgi:hypothetical protein
MSGPVHLPHNVTMGQLVGYHTDEEIQFCDLDVAYKDYDLWNGQMPSRCVG